LKELLEFLIRGLVDLPDSVVIEEVARNGERLFRVQVAPADVGKVIGRQGRTVKAVRALMQALERKTGQRGSLEILETP
jgi:predicted RNA-binding protein YlqC (UPF0109 family)